MFVTPLGSCSFLILNPVSLILSLLEEEVFLGPIDAAEELLAESVLIFPNVLKVNSVSNGKMINPIAPG